MTVDQSSVDLLALIGGNLTKQGNEYVGPCQLCNEGKDRFAVNTDKQRAFCRPCGKSWDAVQWVMERDRVSFRDACGILGLKLEDRPRSSLTRRPSTTPSNIGTAQSKPWEAVISSGWQEKAMAFVHECWKRLHRPGCEDQRAYIAKRGITDLISDVYMLGYNPKNRSERWGNVDVFLPRGFVFPWMRPDDSAVHRVNMRVDDPGDGPKYVQAAGGANWLYLGETVRLGSTAVLVEGELDALSIQQAINHHKIKPVATGSTTGGRLKQWIARLALADRVLVAFDSDKAGEKAAQYWLDVLPNSRRLRPWAHDVNDMLVKGHNLQAWVASGINLQVD